MLRRALSIAAALLLCSCAGTPTREPKPEIAKQGVGSVELALAQREVDSTQVLSVGVATFDPGIPTDIRAQHGLGVRPDLRRAESRYLAYALRNTLDQTGLWGNVRVLPEDDPTADVQVHGTILSSDGTELEVRVRATDSAGVVWLERTYTDLATEADYPDKPRVRTEPFQDLYNQIANDLNIARAAKPARQLRQLGDVSLLRYAAALSPEAFGSYFETAPDGRVELRRLPALSDPMIERITRIRDSEYLFVETVDDHYGALFLTMNRTYTLWRRYDFDQSRALAAYVDRSRDKPPKSPSSLEGMKRSYETFREAKYWEEVLAELATSFSSAVTPTVAETQGDVVELTGSLDEQYQEWRRILRAIFAAETGGIATE